MEIDYYKKSNGDCPVQDFIRKLPAREKVLIIHAIEQLQEKGLALERPLVGYLRDHIRELRIGQHRILHFIYYQDKVVPLHMITKKARKVPDAEIDKALAYKKEYLAQHPREDKKL